MTRCDWCDGGVPSELAIVIAAVAAADREGWAYADRVLGKLRLLGFNVSHQRLAAAMVRMTKVDAPFGLNVDAARSARSCGSTASRSGATTT